MSIKKGRCTKCPPFVVSISEDRCVRSEAVTGPLERVRVRETVVDLSLRTAVLAVADTRERDWRHGTISIDDGHRCERGLHLQRLDLVPGIVLPRTIGRTGETAERRTHGDTQRDVVVVTDIVTDDAAQRPTEQPAHDGRIDLALPRLVGRARATGIEQARDRHDNRHRHHVNDLLHDSIPPVFR